MYNIKYSTRPIINKRKEAKIEKVLSIDTHSNVICSIYQLLNGEICTGSWNNKINVYKYPSLELIETLTPSHDNWVKCFLEIQKENIHYLLSGSRDKTIKVWDINHHPYTEKTTLNYHQGTIFSLITIKDNIISCSFDSSICIINLYSFELLYKITIHQDKPVMKIININTNFYCSCSDYAIIVSEYPNKEICKVSDNITGCIDLYYKRKCIYSLNMNCILNIWEFIDNKVLQCIQTIIIDKRYNKFILPQCFSFIYNKNQIEYIFICCNQKEILCYNIGSYLQNKTQTLKQDNCILSKLIQLSDQKEKTISIISASSSSILTLWKISDV